MTWIDWMFSFHFSLITYCNVIHCSEKIQNDGQINQFNWENICKIKDERSLFRKDKEKLFKFETKVAIETTTEIKMANKLPKVCVCETQIHGKSKCYHYECK